MSPSIRRGLVDRASLLITAQTGPRTNGRPKMDEIESAPFRCRYEEDGSSRLDPDSGRYVRRPELDFGTHDIEGNRLPVVRPGNRIIVRSEQFPDRIFQVVGDPRAIRGRRRVVGWTVTLSRVDQAARVDPRI